MPDEGLKAGRNFPFNPRIMISARYKLNVSLASKDFRAFYRSRFFAVKIKENGLPNSRVGVVVSRKNSPLAVKRNETEREIYRFFEKKRLFLDNFSPPSDFLVIILTSCSEIKDNKEILIKELNNVISI